MEGTEKLNSFSPSTPSSCRNETKDALGEEVKKPVHPIEKMLMTQHSHTRPPDKTFRKSQIEFVHLQIEIREKSIWLNAFSIGRRKVKDESLFWHDAAN